MRIEEYIYTNSKKWNNNVAAFDNSSKIGYKELIHKSQKVASYLQNEGVKNGDRVCIISERDVDGLILVLGILIAGGIYVPISTDYPTKRIEYIIKDSQPKVIIIEDNNSDLKEFGGGSIFKNQVISLALKEKGSSDNKHLGSQVDIAYILYTSGSTGFPKGVMVSHKAALNTLFWMQETFQIKKGECIPQKTSWGFTDSIWELFLPLMVGGMISFISDQEIKNPVKLYYRLKNDNAVITQFVPPALSVFLDHVPTEIEKPELPSLRWVLNGGEELTRKIVDRWFNAFPNVGYANPYGMTESAIYATNYMMKEMPVWGMRKIPIGLPIKNEKVYIISDGNEILGKEKQGEICIGGQSLMIGYWNKKETTDNVLIDHPEIEGLIYKTGDYGMYRADGLLAYLGRKDDQINIRGMRVELGEVKRILLEYQDILQSAVILKDDNENKYIVAFYSTKNTKPIDSKLLFAHTRSYLPEYMVPSYFIHLNEFPLTEHNKIDYRRLNEHEIILSKEINDEILASNGIEAELIKIWREVLQHNNFGKNDAFFNVGGNSLLLMNVYSRLSNDYKSFLKISHLVEKPTIGSLSEFILVSLDIKQELNKVEAEYGKSNSKLLELKKRRRNNGVV